jgi:hypothetical protein
LLETYENRDAFEEAVAARLDEHVTVGEFRDVLARGIAAANEALQPSDAQGRTAELQLRVGRWFLRDDDLPFFETLAAVGPIVATLVATGGIALPAAVAAMASLAGGTWRVWRKGGELTREQMAVLGTLESQGPLDRGQVEARLAEAGEHFDVLAVLDQLQDVELVDGTAVALVRRNPDGRWRTVGV